MTDDELKALRDALTEGRWETSTRLILAAPALLGEVLRLREEKRQTQERLQKAQEAALVARAALKGGEA